MPLPDPRPDDPRVDEGDRELIRRCFALAREAARAGDHPFGALLRREGRVLLEARNTVVSRQDVTRHAELSLVSEAWGRLGPGELETAVLYTSTEPCLMCVGAIHWSGIRRIVFGTGGRPMAEVIGRPYAGIPAAEALERIGSGIEVCGPVLEAEGLEIHAGFWPTAGRQPR